MTSLTTRRPMRVLAAVTAVAVAGSTGIALAPSASAYLGSDATVKGALLPLDRVASAAKWNTGAIALSSSYIHEATNDWTRLVKAASYPDDRVAPRRVELAVSTTVGGRDANWNALRGSLNADADAVTANTATVYTVDRYRDAEGGLPAVFESISVRKVSSDALTLTSCVAPATTTTTMWQRTTCANALGVAQATPWLKISPPNVWRSATAVKAKLLTTKAAKKATKVPAGISVKMQTSSASSNSSYDARVVERAYTVRKISKSAMKKRWAVPYQSSVFQLGNRTNASGLYAQSKAADTKLPGKLRDISSTRYTGLQTIWVSGMKFRIAVTVVRYSSTVVTVGCLSNPAKRPSDKVMRTCSNRLATAQVKKIKPLFSGIR